MAEIVLGIGTSHSPLLTFDAKTWLMRAEDDLRNAELTLSDGRTLSYAALAAERGAPYTEQCREAHLREQALRADRALEHLADALEAARPDVVLIVGDDQGELYSAGNTPSLAIFYGDEIVMRPLGEIAQNPPVWMQQAIGGYAMETDHRFPCASALAQQLIDKLMDQGIDLGVASRIKDPRAAAFGHAFGFVVRRLFRGREIPIIPVLLNTYFPPNVIRPGRCFDIGGRLAEAIAELPSGVRIAIVASGGLSHFVTDADLDRKVLSALARRDAETLRTLPMAALRQGSSEILCWVMAGGALDRLNLTWSELIPVYRTPAGTGIGLAFALWYSTEAATA